MVLIATLIFGFALFIIIRAGQVKYFNAFVLKNLLEKTKSNKKNFNYFKKNIIKFTAGYLVKLPLGDYWVFLKNRIIYFRAEKKYTPEEFLAYKVLFAGTGLIICLGLFNSIYIDIITFFMLFFLPEYELKNEKEKYEREILKELPYALDIITVCVEAGLTFDVAVSKYIYGVKKSFLRYEFEQYLMSLAMGESRGKALKDMSLRVNMRDFSSFISSVLQSDKLGTGIAGTLRRQNSEIRIRRKQRVEKLAMQAPVKLMLPLVIFILPVVFIVILGPIIIQLLANLK